MLDAVTNILNRYDLTGKYLDNLALNAINDYFSTASERIEIVQVIQAQSSKIIKETASKFYTEQPELLRPGGNSYTTRKYAMCLRDIEYYLRYASYALIAGNINILNERVLDGLKDTYNSLNVPIAPTVRSIKILEIVVKETVVQKTSTVTNFNVIEEPFEYMIQSLSEQDI